MQGNGCKRDVVGAYYSVFTTKQDHSNLTILKRMMMLMMMTNRVIASLSSILNHD